MSFGASLSRFTTQAARERTAVFSGPVEGDGCNLQAGATRFRAAFTQLRTGYELLLHGRHLLCTARFLLPPTVEVTLSVGTTVTHLPTGDVYDIVELVPHPGTGEVSVALHRQEP